MGGCRLYKYRYRYKYSFISYININIKDKELMVVRSGHGRLEAVKYSNDFSSFNSYININI